VPISLSAAFEGGGVGPDTKVLIEPGNRANRAGPDPALVKLLAQAHRYNAVFVRGGHSIAEMAREMGVTRSYFTRVLRLSFLAPAIIRAVMLGRQPSTISASTLVSNTRLPMLWKDQLTSLGFA
jgi:lambda repressor-like predicted transcriptional regulator